MSNQKTSFITLSSIRMRSGASAMTHKGNVVLYLDKKLVEKSKEMGFNLSKTFENHLKQLMTQLSTENSSNNVNSELKNNEKWAEPELNRRPLACKANVLTRLDDRPVHFAYPQLDLGCLDL